MNRTATTDRARIERMLSTSWSRARAARGMLEE